MLYRNLVPVAAGVALMACGGGSGPADDRTATTDTRTPRSEVSESGTGDDSRPTVDQVDGAVLTEIPDPCTYLTTEDATELLGTAAGSGRSADAGGWNCIYDVGDPRRRLVLDMQIAQTLAVDSTQLGRTIGYCESEVVERFEDLGVDAAVYRGTAEHCDDDLHLWVATPAVFEGRPRPEFERGGRFHIHLSVALSPPYDSDDDTVAVLRGVAERALARLER